MESLNICRQPDNGDVWYYKNINDSDIVHSPTNPIMCLPDIFFDREQGSLVACGGHVDVLCAKDAYEVSARHWILFAIVWWHHCDGADLPINPLSTFIKSDAP